MSCPQCGGTNEDSARFCSAFALDLGEYKQRWQNWNERRGATGRGTGRPAAGDVPATAFATAAIPAAAPPAIPAPICSAVPGSPVLPDEATVRGRPSRPELHGLGHRHLILCFWPTGIVAVVYASQVGNKLALGDIAGAQESSRKAKIGAGSPSASPWPAS